MGTEVFLALLCWLALTEVSTKVINIASPVRLIDNLNAGSVSRLYRNVPLGVYASASPYAAYSFNVPTFVAPTNNQNFLPTKENSIIQNTPGFLRDSYGQKYHETPQSYKTTFPQQYVQLQSLPAHLSQPLVSTSPNFQLRQVTPHFFGSSQFSAPSLQSFSPTLINRFVQASQPSASQAFTQATYSQSIRNMSPQQLPPITHSQIVFKPATQSQPLTNKKEAQDTHTNEKFSSPKNEQKQHHVKVQSVHSTPEIIEQNAKQSQQSIKKEKLQRQKDPIVTTHVNGDTIVTIPTKPNLPLLDLSLLEPLTFDNPLVPQVQHFLPKIHQVTYHKLPNLNDKKKHRTEFIVQNTKSYDSTHGKGKPKKESPKKKQKKPRPQNEHKDDEDDNPIKSVTVIGGSNESPEFSYEINSPNYKETYTEKKVKYNKETQSEPVHYNYEKQTQKDPVHYSYEKHTQSEPVHYSYTTSSKEPSKTQKIVYSNKEEPRQLIFHFKPEDSGHNYEERVLSSPQTESEEQYNRGSSDAKKNQEETHSHNNNDHEELQEESHKEKPKNKHQYQPEHREEAPSQEHNDNSEYHNNDDERNEHKQHEEQKYSEKQYSKPENIEYEEDIIILPKYPPKTASNENLEEEDRPHKKHNSHAPTKHYHSSHNLDEIQYAPEPVVHEKSHKKPTSHAPTKHYHSSHSPDVIQYAPEPVVHEKSKRIIIKQETPDESQSDDGSKLMAEMIKQQEESEDDFENAYKNAAYGFPAFDTPSIDAEKEIYNPDSYGAGKYRQEYDIENTPLQQYQVSGDDYPSETRANYKDERDKMQEEYYLDYAISRPESILQRYKNKDDYYKVFTHHQKPEKYTGDNEEKKKNAKYTFAFHSPQKEEKQQKSAPYVYGYNFVKEAPRDNSAFATGPVDYRYKSKTQFVEPQYQYGFEPISIPQLLDSELAAMASNDNLESENPGTRKKLYKENWYIKKTTTGKAR